MAITKRLAGPALAVLLAVSSAPVAGAQGQAGATPAAEVTAAISDLTDWFTSVGGGELVTAGPPVVVDRAGGQAVRLPGLALRMPDAVVTFGDLEFTRADIPGGLWRLTGALPARITVETPDMPPMVVTLASSSFDVEIDPRSGQTGNARIDVTGLSAVLEPLGRFSIAEIQLGNDVVHGANGRATLTSSYHLGGLSVTTGAVDGSAPPMEVARVKAITGTSRLDGVDWSRMVEMQAFVLANQTALTAGDDPELASRLQLLATTPDLLASGFDVRFGVEEAWLDEAAGGPFSLAGARFHFNVSGLTGDSATASIGYGHDGLKVAAALPVDAAAVPETLSVEIAADRVPGRRLVELLQAGMEDEAALVEAMQQAGTTARMTRAKIRMDGMGADLDVEVSASAAAPDGVIGKGELTIVNLDRIVAALGPLVTDEMAAIQLAAALAQRAEGAGGVTHRWTVARDASGITTLNGNDVSALVALESGVLGEGPDGVGLEDASTDATEPVEMGAGLTAELVAARLEEFGIAASIGQDEAGDPSVSAEPTGALERQTLGVQFFDCGPDGVCESCMLYLVAETAKQVAFTQLNEWNSNERWVRVYRGEDKQLVLEMDIAGEGASEASIDAALGRFLDTAERFVAEVIAQR